MHEQSIRMGEGGRLVIPAMVRNALGVKPGDELIIRFEDGEIRLFQQRHALQRLRAELKRHGVENFTVDDFLRNRRSEWGE